MQQFSVYYPDVCLEHSDCRGSLWFYLHIVVTVVLLVVVGPAGRPTGRPDHEQSTTITTI
jgi:hypothetical protein